MTLCGRNGDVCTAVTLLDEVQRSPHGSAHRRQVLADMLAGLEAERVRAARVLPKQIYFPTPEMEEEVMSTAFAQTLRNTSVTKRKAKAPVSPETYAQLRFAMWYLRGVVEAECRCDNSRAQEAPMEGLSVALGLLTVLERQVSSLDHEV